MVDNYSNLIIEKAENGFIILKGNHERTTGLLGSGDAMRKFSPHIAKDENDLIKVIKDLVKNIKSTTTINEEKEKALIVSDEDDEDNERY